jgi:hypothetical protein
LPRPEAPSPGPGGGSHPEALERCHAIDDLALAWIEEPIVYDSLEWPGVGLEWDEKAVAAHLADNL